MPDTRSRSRRRDADVLQAFERLSIAAGTIDAFETALDDAITRGAVAAEEPRRVLLLARARALAAHPVRADDAARVYRAVLDDGRVRRGAQGERAGGVRGARRARPGVAAARCRPAVAPRVARRARAGRGARRAPARVGARTRRRRSRDPAQALALHRRVLDVDADCDEALASRRAPRPRDRRHRGGARGAADAARSRRGRRAHRRSSSRSPQVLLARTTRWREALASLRAVLAETPGDASGARARRAAPRAPRDARRSDRHARAGVRGDRRRRGARADPPRLLDGPRRRRRTARRGEGLFERLCDLQRERGARGGRSRPALRAARELPRGAAPVGPRRGARARRSRGPTTSRPSTRRCSRGRSRASRRRCIGERAVQFYEEWFDDSARVVRDPRAGAGARPDGGLGVRPAEAPARRGGALGRPLRALRPRARLGRRARSARRSSRTRRRPRRTSPIGPTAPSSTSSSSRSSGRATRSSRAPSSASTSGRASTASSCPALGARLPALEARRGAAHARRAWPALWLDELGDAAAALEAIEPMLARTATRARTAAAADVWTPPRAHPRRGAGEARSRAGRRSLRRRAGGTRPGRAAAQVGAAASTRGSVRQRAAGVAARALRATGRDADLARDAARRARGGQAGRGARAPAPPDRGALREARRPRERARAGRASRSCSRRTTRRGARSSRSSPSARAGSSASRTCSRRPRAACDRGGACASR